MSAVPQPSGIVGMKLGSLVVHADEALSDGGHHFDVEAFRALLEDPDVQEYLRQLDARSLLPVRRNP